jgi:hypothetical protein
MFSIVFMNRFYENDRPPINSFMNLSYLTIYEIDQPQNLKKNKIGVPQKSSKNLQSVLGHFRNYFFLFMKKIEYIINFFFNYT